MKTALHTGLALCLMLACSACKTDDPKPADSGGGGVQPTPVSDTKAFDAKEHAKAQAAAAFDALDKMAEEEGDKGDDDGARLLSVSGKKLSAEEATELKKMEEAAKELDELEAKLGKEGQKLPEGVKPNPGDTMNLDKAFKGD